MVFSSEVLLLLNTVFDVPVAQIVQVPLYLAATCTLLGVRLWSAGLWIFWRSLQEWFPYAALCFDSGYVFGVSLRGLMEDFHTFPRV